MTSMMTMVELRKTLPHRENPIAGS